MIRIENVSKHYGAFQVLTDCSTTVDKGEVVVPVVIKDESGEQPIQAEMTWAWVPKKKG